MAVNLISYDHAEEEDYIDMEVSSFSTFLCNSITSPSNPNEFEFQMSSSAPLERKSTSSPADELFYKGKLLPLHMLQNPNSASEDFYSTPLATTPFESCNASPSQSCLVSCEVNPEDHSTELGDRNPKRSWTRKLNVINKSSLGSKLKASRAYLRSFFGASKSGCSDESCGKASKKSSFQRSTTVNAKIMEEGGVAHRRSFSLSIRRCSANKPSPSSSSSGSSSWSNLKHLKRSSSVKPEMESPIQGAIAHCKQSQQMFRSTKTMSEVGDDQERPEGMRF